MPRIEKFAMDKASARKYDAQGFLHVEACNISKSTVNPYLGAEIPNYQQLNLDPGKTYFIFRPPEELTKAASTANMIPLMDAHIEVSAFDLMNPEIACHQVGTTGETAVFESPYLINSLSIWKADAIQGVLTKEQTELSCAYRYDIDMTPGMFDGIRYDGSMKNIKFNHVALVVEGRAGPDVTVADSGAKLKERKMQLKEQIVQAMRHGIGSRIEIAMDVIRKEPGHKNSKGEAAPVVIKSERTGKTIWSGKTKKEAGKAVGRMKAFKEKS